MKYVITGSAGHISKPLALELLKGGHEVTVIGRNRENLKAVTDAGAHAAIGSVDDAAFLIKTFTGADAVYLMTPPKFDAPSMKAHIAESGKKYADAVQKSGVEYVVHLSSVGAHMPDGAGPVSGLHFAEQYLNEIPEINVLHLRPAYFYYNLMANISLIKQAGIIGSNFGGPEFKMPIVDTNDIAAVAANALLKLDFSNKSVLYIASDEVSSDTIAKEIGKAIGKPELPWIVFSNEQAYDGMIQAGLPEDAAKNYVEMGTALQSGEMQSDYWKNRPSTLGKTKLTDFAKQFAAAFSQA